MGTIWKVLTRRKVLDPVTSEQSQLRRVLNTFDLTALGVGSTLGVGVYVLAGHVAKDTAGPAVVLSFLIAAIASVFAGLCYAEFGARAPRAGSAYIYSYVCVGEFVAFVIGWNLILEYVIGSASVARGLSLYLDTLLNNTLQRTFTEIAPINVEFMSAYFDFLAFGISILLAVALAFGMKESSWANNVFTVLNLGVVIFVIIAGSIKADGHNWDLSPPNNTSIHAGSGGFFPFGIEGMIKGAATCFYGFVGFDCIATTAEEVKNPKRAIPFSIIVSLFIIFLAYFGTSTVVTLMVPYYLQDPNAPIPHAFEVIGWEIPKWIVAIGGIFGLCASLFGAMFPLPRIIYAMASDGLVFRFLGKVSDRFKTPVIGTLLAGLLTGLMGALFELKQLVNMMSIGTLLAYTIVAASVLLLRYAVDKDVVVYQPVPVNSDSDDNDMYVDNRAYNQEESNDEIQLIQDETVTAGSLIRQIYNCGGNGEPTRLSEKIVSIQLYIYCILCLLIGLCAMYLKTQIANAETWAIVITALVLLCTVLVIMSIATQPKSKKELSFKVPFVPIIPALSILINIYLMLMLDSHTWIRFAVWMAIGIPTYYFSVKNHFKDVRNMSISSKANSHVGNGKVNGFTNGGVDDVDDQVVDDVEKKGWGEASPEKIESTIRILDDVLEKEEDELRGRRLSATDTISNNSDVLLKESVVAVVHCDNVVTPPVECLTEALPFPMSSLDNNVISPLELVQPDNPDAEISDTNEDNSQVIPANQSAESAVSKVEPDEEAHVDQSQVVDEQSNIPPPPPPPMLENLWQQVDVTIPRPKIAASALSSVKLKKTKRRAPTTPPPLTPSSPLLAPPTPPVDYSRQNSDMPDLVGDTNLKKGTPEYQAFRDKLNKDLQVPYLPKTYEAQPDPARRSTLEHPPNEDVIQEHLNRSEAKSKLLNFLEKSPKGVTFIPVAGSQSRLEDQTHDDYDDDDVRDNDVEYDRERHKRNMNSILGSIRLRKEDSFNAGNSDNSIPTVESKPPDESTNLDNYREQHKRNMNSALGSIKLRKEDSFNDKFPQNELNGLVQ